MKKIKEEKLFWTFLVLSISIACALLICYLIENDYFWHIKAGEYMVQNHILKHDVFSWSVSGKYWMSHEWLFEIILYGLKRIFHGYHVYVYCLVCLLSIYLFLYLSKAKEILKNIPYSLAFLFFLSLSLVTYIQARPHMLDFLFFLITVYALYDLYENKESKKIYLLPLISILWSNIHGGSSNLPYLMCFLFWLGGQFSFQFKKIESNRLDKKKSRKYIIVMLLCMLAVCVNIHGIKMFFYPYENMLDKTMLYNITEWQNTSLSVSYHYLYYEILLYFVFTMLLSEKKIRFLDLLVFGFMMYLGLKSIRFWAFTPLACTYFIFYYVKERKLDRGTIPILLTISILLFGVSIFHFATKEKLSYQINLKKELITILKEEKPKALFNMYDYGGELVYHDIPVFIDGRADLYSPYNYKDYLALSKLERDPKRLIEKYDFDYFLVDSTYPINIYLKYQKEYEVIYQDLSKNILLYKKTVN